MISITYPMCISGMIQDFQLWGMVTSGFNNLGFVFSKLDMSPLYSPILSE
jgi:hypothetical protein